MQVYIKNMVCDSCIGMVKSVLNRLSISFNKVELGELEITNVLKDDQIIELKTELHKLGFELLDNKKASLISRVKSFIIKYVHTADPDLANKKLSVLLAET